MQALNSLVDSTIEIQAGFEERFAQRVWPVFARSLNGCSRAGG